jgi:hypothetical protein
MRGDTNFFPALPWTRQSTRCLGIGKSNGLFHRPRPPTPCHPAAILPAAARAWGRPARPAPAAGQRWIPPAGRRLAPQRTDRMGDWGRAACTAGAARGAAAGGRTRSPSLPSYAPRSAGTIFALMKGRRPRMTRPLASVSWCSAPPRAWRLVHRERLGCLPPLTLRQKEVLPS